MLTQYTTRINRLKVIETQITLHPPYTRLSSLKGSLAYRSVFNKIYQSQTINAGDQFMNIHMTGEAQATIPRFLQLCERNELFITILKIRPNLHLKDKSVL